MARNRIARIGTLVAAAVMIAAAQSAQAVVFVEDTFNTNTTNGGIGWDAGSSWTAGVSGGELNYTGGAQSRLFAAPLTASDYWMAITWEAIGIDNSFTTTGAWEGAGGQPYFLGYDSRNAPEDRPRFPNELSGQAATTGGYNTTLLHFYNVSGSGFTADGWVFSGDETSINPAALGAPNWKNGVVSGTSNTEADRWIIQGGQTTDFDRISIADNQFEVLGQAVPEISSIGLNFAGASNNPPGPDGRKPIDAADSAGAPGYAQINWNNTPGTGQTGTPSSANDTMLNLKDVSGLSTSLDVTFTSPQTWGTDFGANPTPDQQLKGNSINSGVQINVSEIPFAEYDVVVYFSNYQNGAFDATITLTLEDTSELQRFVTSVWEDSVSGSGDIGWVEVTDAAIDSASRQTGNYTVFRNITGSSFILDTLGFAPGISGIQIVNTAVAAVPSPAALPAGLIGLLLVTLRRRRHAAP